MPTLSPAQVKQATDELQRELSEIREPMGPLTKAQLLAALTAADAWVDSNAASFNSALPAAARTALTARQKTWLLLRVLIRRFRDLF